MLLSLTLAALTLSASADEVLFPPDVEAEDVFGFRMAVDGDRMLVSSIGDVVSGIKTGSVTVWRRSSGSWVLEAQLLPSPLQLYQNFGWQVELEGTRAVVSAPVEDGVREDQGAVYVFELIAGQWTQVQRIVAVEPQEGAHFGSQIALSGDRLVIGSPFVLQGAANGFRGILDVHRLEAGQWRSEQVLASAAGQASWDGKVLDLQGDTLVSTLQSWTAADGFEQAVNVFERSPVGWQLVQTITAPLNDPTVLNSFGDELHLEGPWLLVSAIRRRVDGFVRAGSVFSYRLDGGGSWGLTDTIEPVRPESETFFGWHLDLDGSRAIVGIDSEPGASGVYLYQEKGGRWGLERRLETSYPGAARDFGYSVGVSGDDVLAGSTSAQSAGEFSGAVLRSELPPASTSFCDPAPSSLGQPAWLFLEGGSSLSEGGQSFRVRPVPDDFGLVFMGDLPVDQPFGSGRRCVGGTLVRLEPRLAEGGELVLPLSTAALGIASGQTAYFQAWFRDSQAPPFGFQLSDALAVTFQD